MKSNLPIVTTPWVTLPAQPINGRSPKSAMEAILGVKLMPDKESDVIDLIRDTNRDVRQMARDVGALQVQVARVAEQVAQSAPIIKEHKDDVQALARRVEALEAQVPKAKTLVSVGGAVLGAIVVVVLVAMYLVAGGDPHGIKELVH